MTRRPEDDEGFPTSAEISSLAGDVKIDAVAKQSRAPGEEAPFGADHATFGRYHHESPLPVAARRPIRGLLLILAALLIVAVILLVVYLIRR